MVVLELLLQGPLSIEPPEFYYSSCPVSNKFVYFLSYFLQAYYKKMINFWLVERELYQLGSLGHE